MIVTLPEVNIKEYRVNIMEDYLNKNFVREIKMAVPEVVTNNSE